MAPYIRQLRHHYGERVDGLRLDEHRRPDAGRERCHHGKPGGLRLGARLRHLAHGQRYLSTKLHLAAAGCDSTHSVTLTLGRGITTTERLSACDSALVFGTWRTASDTYTKTFLSAQGCDSMHTVALTLGEAIATTEELRGCDSALVFGTWRTASGAYTSDPQASAQGCDSVHTVMLALGSSVATMSTLQACDSALVFGTWRDVAGDYQQTYTSAQGCDSMHTVALTLGEAIATTEALRGCDSALVFGTWRTASGAYTSDPQASAQGCDSAHTVMLNLDISVATASTLQACDSALVFGTWRDVAGDYQQTYTSAQGCDSMHTVALTLGEAIATTEELRGCDSARVFGTWRTASGAYTSDPQASAQGCDSVHTVMLNLGSSVATMSTLQACDSALVFGTWRDVAGDYQQTYTSAQGCDSMHTVALTLGEAIATTEALRGCDSALVFGTWRYASGTYASPPQASAQAGCDSVHTVQLTIVPGLLSPGAGSWPADTTLASGASLELELPPAPPGERYVYSWRPPSAVDCDTCARVAVDTGFAGRLLAVLQSGEGCRAERELLIERLVLATQSSVYPNAFSPNGDGVNDDFGITLPPGAMLRQAQIYDRWGGMVGETVCPCTLLPSGETVLWDGRHAKQNQLVQVGVYVWLAEVEHANDGRREVLAGEVTVVR